MTQYEKGFNDCKKQVKAAMVAAIEEAILMERAACAALCYAEGKVRLAETIRARGEK